MTTVRADDVRIPRSVREAVARHERVVVLNRERAVLAIVHPDDLDAQRSGVSRRSVREIAVALEDAPAPDAEFANDLEAVLGAIGPAPEDPWGRS